MSLSKRPQHDFCVKDFFYGDEYMNERPFPNPTEAPKDQQTEKMPMPEIVFQEELGSQLMSVLLRAHDATVEASDPSLAASVDALFQSDQECQMVLVDYRRVRAAHHIEDDETLYQLALTYDNPIRVPYVLEMIRKHKPWVVNASQAAESVQSLMTRLESRLESTGLADGLRQYAQQDVAERELSQNDLKARLKRHIDFFRPSVSTTHIRRVNYASTDPLRPKQSGYAAMLGDEQVVVSHRENTGNQEHEFLHGIINPITRKLAGQLNETDKTHIVALASSTLRLDYGDDWESLLNEEIIRAYNDEFQHDAINEKRVFLDQINRLDATSFQSLCQDTKKQSVFATLGIASLEDLKAKAMELYEYQRRESHHGLRGRILDMYHAYADRDDKKTNFEMFLYQKIKELISE